MTREEKVEAIKKAVKGGVAKRRIDLEGNGAKVRQLLKGKNLSEKCIERIYGSLLEYQKNPGYKPQKARREKYLDMHPEVPAKEKKKTILKAIKSGVKKNHLDPFGGGDAVRKIEKNHKVGIAKINEMYANLLSMEKKVAKTFSGKKTNKQKMPSKKTNAVQEKETSKDSEKDPRKRDCALGDYLNLEILKQNRQIVLLLEKVQILENKIEELFGTVTPKTPLKVLGLTVTQKQDVVKGRKYRRWYAIYRKNGTRRWIYIGKDINKAEEKIRSWLEKNGDGNA